MKPPDGGEEHEWSSWSEIEGWARIKEGGPVVEKLFEECWE